jgi:chromosome segregation ATPase
MKVRDLLILAAFVLGGIAVAYGPGAVQVLRQWEYTSPLCIRAERAWADATGASRAQLEAELARVEVRMEGQKEALSRLRESLHLAIEELGRSDAHVAKLADDLAHSERVRDTQDGELAHCRQLIEAQEAVVRETNWRYQQLANRVRALGDEGAVSVLAPSAAAYTK